MWVRSQETDIILFHLTHGVLLLHFQIQHYMYIPPVVLTPNSHEHLHTHTPNTSSPRTLYSSAQGSHRRRCRWNTPPSPAPSARCQRSENQNRTVWQCSPHPANQSPHNRNTPQKCVFSRLHHQICGYILLWTLYCVSCHSLSPSSPSQTLGTHFVLAYTTIRWCSVPMSSICYCAKWHMAYVQTDSQLIVQKVSGTFLFPT